MWVQISMCQAEMEKRKAAQPPEGQEPKTAVEIVEEVLKIDVKHSTFLENIGLKSSSTQNKATTAVVAAHVQDLQEKLERSEKHAQAIEEEMATLKKKSEEAEAAAVLRDKAYEEMRQRMEEQDGKFASFVALLGARATGI